MSGGWEIEIEPEVRHWLDNLSDRDYLQAEHAAERLLDAPTTHAEVDRAKQARKLCEAEDHTAHDEFTRDVTKGEGP